MHGRVGIHQQPVVRDAKITVAFGLADAVAEPGERLRKDPAETADHHLDFAVTVGAKAHHHDLADPLGMPDRVGQAQHRAPGSTEQEPLVDAEVDAQAFEIAQEMFRGVGGKVHVGITGERQAAATPTLVEQHGPVARRIEVPAQPFAAAAAGPAVDHHGRFTLGVSTGLPVERVPATDVEHAVVVRFDLGVEPGHQPSFPPDTTALLH